MLVGKAYRCCRVGSETDVGTRRRQGPESSEVTNIYVDGDIEALVLGIRWWDGASTAG